jgi:hypothetical protein
MIMWNIIRGRRSPKERIRRQRLPPCARTMRILTSQMLSPEYGSWKRVMMQS